MASPSARDAPSLAATHYEVLGLTPSILDDCHPQDPAALVKKAYRRALLRYHPDKSTPSAPSDTSKTPSDIYTIDQITTAFNILSSMGSRREYDASLRLSQALPGKDPALKFQTGVENVDLDDLPFDDSEERWYRSCRCGNERGYLFGEDDLLEVEDEGVLMVGCQDCSLWLRVHFAVIDDEGPPDAENNTKS